MAEKMKNRRYAFVQEVMGQPFEPSPMFVYLLGKWREYYKVLSPGATDKEAVELIHTLGLYRISHMGKDIVQLSKQARAAALEECHGRDRRDSDSS